MNADILDNCPVMTSRGSNRLDKIRRIPGDSFGPISEVL
jgi:hypothetical protein